ncbi:MAG TPA: hypothetical protein VFS43_45695 [Polyangiaceae bacterium]|nr:hypothetical protein [Polyangiaceae bacterium]
MKRLLASLLGGALTMLPTTALAQGPSGFGTQGQFVLGVERLFGLNFYNGHYEPDNGGPDRNQSRTQFSLLWNNASVGGLPGLNPYAIPRVTFDYAVIDNLTIGGSIGYASVSGEDDIDGPLDDDDYETATLFAFSPRVGYILRFNDIVGMWLRGGVTYYSIGQDDFGTASGFGINLEPGFIFTVAPGFGISATPSLDLPIAGSFNDDAGVDNADGDYRVRNFGANAGLFFYF